MRRDARVLAGEDCPARLAIQSLSGDGQKLVDSVGDNFRRYVLIFMIEPAEKDALVLIFGESQNGLHLIFLHFEDLPRDAQSTIRFAIVVPVTRRIFPQCRRQRSKLFHFLAHLIHPSQSTETAAHGSVDLSLVPRRPADNQKRYRYTDNGFRAAACAQASVTEWPDLTARMRPLQCRKSRARNWCPERGGIVALVTTCGCVMRACSVLRLPAPNKKVGQC